MKHWTEFLPEAGRQALRLGQQQVFKDLKIKEAQEQLANLKFEYEDEEKNIREIVGSTGPKRRSGKQSRRQKPPIQKSKPVGDHITRIDIRLSTSIN